MGPSGRFTHVIVILMFGTGYMQVLYLGRAPRTKETLPDFREECRVTRHSRVFRGLSGSQRAPGFWGVTMRVLMKLRKHNFSMVTEDYNFKPNLNLPTHYTLALRNHGNFSYGPATQQGQRPMQNYQLQHGQHGFQGQAQRNNQRVENQGQRRS